MADREGVEKELIALVRQFAPGLSGTGAVVRKRPLTEAGLTALAAVRLMLAIEQAFAIDIPESEVTPENFASLDAIAALIARRRDPRGASRGGRPRSVQRLEPAAPMQQAGRPGAETDRLHGADDDRVGVTL